MTQVRGRSPDLRVFACCRGDRVVALYVAKAINEGGIKVIRKVSLGLLAITFIMLGAFFPSEAVQAESIVTKPLFHLSKVRGGEFYTTDLAEKKEMIRDHGYADMGVACYIVDPEIAQPDGMLPFYRLKYTGDYQGTVFHEYLYTTSQNEVDDYVGKSGWSLEGTAGYVMDKDSSLAGTVPLYRWYCPSAYHWHGYSTDLQDTWITKLHQGVQYEGIACRVWEKECSLDISRGELEAPYDLKAVNYSEGVRLTWKNPRNQATAISIERKTSDRSFRKIATVVDNVTRYTDDSVSLNTSYTYRIRAWRDGQSSPPSNQARVYTDDHEFRDRSNKKPSAYRRGDAPTNLEATVLSYSKINLTWDQGDFPALGYRVERRSNSGSWVTVANVGFRTRTFTDSGLNRYTRYHYRVQAYHLLGDSDYSDEITVSTASYYAKSDDDWWSSDEYYYDNQSVVIKLQVGNKKHSVNQALKNMDTAPFISQGRTLVPIRFLAEAIGAEVDWNDYQKKATISYDGEVMELWVGRNTARINGERFSIDPSNAQLTPLINNGRIMLPLRFITENLGFDVYWVEQSKEIILTYLY